MRLRLFQVIFLRHSREGRNWTLCALGSNPDQITWRQAGPSRKKPFQLEFRPSWHGDGRSTVRDCCHRVQCRVGVVVLPRSSTLRHTGRSCHHDALLLLLPYGYVQATSACSPSVIQCPPAGRPRACERASAQCHHPLFFYARPITSVHNPRHFPGCY